MAEEVVTSRVAEGLIVAVIGFGRREERRGLVVAPLADVDPAKKAARERGAKGIAALLPPREALRQ